MQKVEGNRAKKYLNRMRSQGDMAVTKSTNPTKKIEKVEIFTENVISCNVVAPNPAPLQQSQPLYLC